MIVFLFIKGIILDIIEKMEVDLSDIKVDFDNKELLVIFVDKEIFLVSLVGVLV